MKQNRGSKQGKEMLQQHLMSSRERKTTCAQLFEKEKYNNNNKQNNRIKRTLNVFNI